jgi:hypothetical protein
MHTPYLVKACQQHLLDFASKASPILHAEQPHPAHAQLQPTQHQPLDPDATASCKPAHFNLKGAVTAAQASHLVKACQQHALYVASKASPMLHAAQPTRPTQLPLSCRQHSTGLICCCIHLLLLALLLLLQLQLLLLGGLPVRTNGTQQLL